MRNTLFLLLLAAACTKEDSRVAEGVRSPTLANREEILAQRQRLADQVLQPGDSIIVPVYIYVDPTGLPKQPEIKMEPLDPRVHDAALELVRNMRFHPATKDGKPTTVMLTVPVKLVRR